MLKNSLSLPKLLYFVRTSTCFNHPALLQKYDKTVSDGLSKVCNVNFDGISSTQLALPAEMAGMGFPTFVADHGCVSSIRAWAPSGRSWVVGRLVKSGYCQYFILCCWLIK